MEQIPKDLEANIKPQNDNTEPAAKPKEKGVFALMRKATIKEVVQQEKNHKLSYFYGLCSAIVLGTANMLVVELTKFGLKAMLCEFLGIIAPFIFYHLYCYV